MRAPEGSRLKLVALLFALAVAFFASPDAEAGAIADRTWPELAEVGLTERVAVDRISGVAISGYDPVAYFVTGEAVAGSSRYEIIWNGAAWRFANQGNRDAFLADPAVYAPRFGGYDADAVASGITTPGDPHVFAITGDRLFLFRDVGSRKDFLASPARAEAAETAWPGLESALIR
jgi:hypothetical protein